MNRNTQRILNGVARKIIPGASETLDAYNALRRYAEAKEPHKLTFALSALQGAAKKFRAHAMDESTRWRGILSMDSVGDDEESGGDE